MRARHEMAVTNATNVTSIERSSVAYSICTLITDHSQYSDIIQSFVKAGFTYNDCEYLYIDNSFGNTYDAFSGINQFLLLARGTYVIICHQDVSLTFDDRRKLDAVIQELDTIDPNWGMCGNAGSIYPGRHAIQNH